MAGVKGRPKHQQHWISQGLFGLSVVFLLLGLISLAWAVWPSSTDAVQINIPAGALPATPDGTDFASLADYELSISWPRWVRLGDSGSIDVFLSGVVGQADDGTDQAIQVILIETTLQRLRVEPAGLVQHNIAPGTDLNVLLAVEAVQKGEFPGKVLVSFGFFDDENDEMVPVPVAVVDVTVQVKSWLGLETGIVIWLGFVSLVLWGVLFLLGRYMQVR